MGDIEFKHIIVAIVIVIAALIAAGLSVYQYFTGVQKEKKNDSLQKELIQTQAELNKLQNETLKRIMGFGYAVVKVVKINANRFELLLESKSDYPIYATEVYVYDQDKLNQCPKIMKNGQPHIMYDCYVKSGITRDINTLVSRKIRPLKIEKQLQENEYHIMIKTLTKHNTIFQYSIVKSDLKNNTVDHYYRVYELINKEYLLMEKDDLNISEEKFEEIFSYKKQIDLFYN
jgi:hypothetical protein